MSRFKFSIVFLVIAVCMLGCTPSDSNKVRSLLIESAKASKTRDVTLDLSSTVKGIEKLCLQGPYITQEPFEELIEKKVKNFYQAGERAFILWIFLNSEKESLQIKFYAGELSYSREISPICTESTKVLVRKKALYLNR
jgi:hypothetical protein